MIDRSANLRAIVTGRGNTADLVNGARSCFKKVAHKRMRMAGKVQIAEQLDDMRAEHEAEYERMCDRMYDDYLHYDDWDPIAVDDEIIAEWIDEQEAKHQQKLARRRARYHERKVASQVSEYEQLLAALKKLDAKLEPEARLQLSEKGALVVL